VDGQVVCAVDHDEVVGTFQQVVIMGRHGRDNGVAADIAEGAADDTALLRGFG
jgi:hypothetical protein